MDMSSWRCRDHRLDHMITRQTDADHGKVRVDNRTPAFLDFAVTDRWSREYAHVHVGNRNNQRRKKPKRWDRTLVEREYKRLLNWESAAQKGQDASSTEEPMFRRLRREIRKQKKNQKNCMNSHHHHRRRTQAEITKNCPKRSNNAAPHTPPPAPAATTQQRRGNQQQQPAADAASQQQAQQQQQRQHNTAKETTTTENGEREEEMRQRKERERRREREREKVKMREEVRERRSDENHVRYKTQKNVVASGKKRLSHRKNSKTKRFSCENMADCETPFSVFCMKKPFRVQLGLFFDAN